MLAPSISPATGQGIVLSSGGADGAYAVGVMRALVNGHSPATNYQPIDPRVFVGTSIGAFNAACMVSCGDGSAAAAVAELERIWREELSRGGGRFGGGAFRVRLNPFELLAPHRLLSSPFETAAQIAADSLCLAEDFLTRGRNFLTSKKNLSHRLLNTINFSALVSVAPFEEIIEKNVSLSAIRNAARKLVVITTNSDRGALEYFINEGFTESDGRRILLASTAIPGLFPAVRLRESSYIDGAVLGYTKLAPAINAGAQTLHLIYIDPGGETGLSQSNLVSTAESLYRMFVISWSARVARGTGDAARINQQAAFLGRFAERNRISREERRRLFEEMLPPRSFEDEEKDSLPRQVTIHRYRPSNELFGPLGLVNLDPRRVAELIRRGFEDTVHHDCAANNCVLPTG